MILLHLSAVVRQLSTLSLPMKCPALYSSIRFSHSILRSINNRTLAEINSNPALRTFQIASLATEATPPRRKMPSALTFDLHKKCSVSLSYLLFSFLSVFLFFFVYLNFELIVNKHRQTKRARAPYISLIAPSRFLSLCRLRHRRRSRDSRMTS